jgi:hypothetical protein
MKRILISEDERNYILGMHQEKGYKPLMEQSSGLGTSVNKEQPKMQGVTNIQQFTNLGADSAALSKRLTNCGFGNFEATKEGTSQDAVKTSQIASISKGLQDLLKQAATVGYDVNKIASMNFGSIQGQNYEFIKTFFYGPNKQTNVNFAVPFQKLVVGQIKAQNPNYQTTIQAC